MNWVDDMADYIDTHNDFFYPKSETGLGAFIRLRKIRKMQAECLTELRYVFPQQVVHGQIIKYLEESIVNTINLLDDVLQKNKTKESRKGRS